jgi:hypothetical protein
MFTSFQPSHGYNPSILAVVSALLTLPMVSAGSVPQAPLAQKTPTLIKPTQAIQRLSHDSILTTSGPSPSGHSIRPRDDAGYMVSGYAYKGCMVDNSAARILAAGRQDEANIMDLELCRNL